MKNFEKYIDEIIDKSNVDYIAHFYGNMETCSDCKSKKDCFDCLGSRVERVKKWLLQEYKEPIKLKQWEYDLIRNCEEADSYSENDSLSAYWIIEGMKKNGHFKGIKNLRVRFKDVLDNYIIVSDDYEGFEECK